MTFNSDQFNWKKNYEFIATARKVNLVESKKELSDKIAIKSIKMGKTQYLNRYSTNWKERELFL